MAIETALTFVSAVTGKKTDGYTLSLSRGEPITSSSKESLGYSVSLSRAEPIASWSVDDFNQHYFELVRSRISPMLNTVLTNLINSRDLLGGQLNLEFGNISQDEYDELEKDLLLEPIELNSEQLKSDVIMLMKLSRRVYNAEEVSTMFNCQIMNAESAISSILLEEKRS